MALRTTVDKVKKIIETDDDFDLTPFLSVANVIVDKVAEKDTDAELSSTALEEIEKWLAAHFYAIRDQQYQSKSVGGASGSFQGQTAMGFDSTFWGQMAKRMDVSGYLASMDRTRYKPQFAWLGKAPSDQIDYEDRD